MTDSTEPGPPIEPDIHLEPMKSLSNEQRQIQRADELHQALAGGYLSSAEPERRRFARHQPPTAEPPCGFMSELTSELIPAQIHCRHCHRTAPSTEFVDSSTDKPLEA